MFAFDRDAAAPETAKSRVDYRIDDAAPLELQKKNSALHQSGPEPIVTRSEMEA